MSHARDIIGKIEKRSWKSNLCFWFGLFCLWEIAALSVNNPKLFPDLWYLLSNSLPSLAIFNGKGENDFIAAIQLLTYHTAQTFWRLLIGLILGSVTGFGAGLAISYFAKYRKGSFFLLTIIRSIPLFSLVPLFLMWFGGKEIGIYLYIAFAVFLIVASDTYEATLNIPKHFILQAQVLGASKLQVLFTVSMFAIRPQMLGSIRNLLGLCWAFSLGAEFVSSVSGLGYLLYNSYLYADMGKMIIVALVYISCGWLAYYLFKNKLTWFYYWNEMMTTKAIN